MTETQGLDECLEPEPAVIRASTAHRQPPPLGTSGSPTDPAGLLASLSGGRTYPGRMACPGEGGRRRGQGDLGMVLACVIY